jgi:SAM-dependent methyltransferase
MPCPACRSEQTTEGRTIGFCRCGHRWLLTTEARHTAVEEDTYTSEYAGYVPDEAFASFARQFMAKELVPRCQPPARLLDVGCGSGEFMQIAEDLGYETSGIDVSEAAAEICRSKGLDARAGDLLTERFPAKFDLITMWDVVEHLRDPHAVLTRASELLNDGGYLFAKVPAFGLLSVRLSDAVPRLSGLLLGAPGHVQFFTRSSLERLGGDVGLLIECRQGGDIRSRRKPQSTRRRIGRMARTAIKGLSGDHNLFLFAAKQGQQGAERSQSFPRERS